MFCSPPPPCPSPTRGEGTPASRAEPAAKRRDLITVLQRATQPEHGAKAAGQAAALLGHLVRMHTPTLAEDIVAVMTDTPGRLREVLDAALGDLERDALSALDFALPLMHLQLLELALSVSQRHCGLTRAALAEVGQGRPEVLEPARSAYAAAVGQLGIRYSNLNRREDALKASEEAVDIYRALAKDRPDVFRPDLASSLSVMSDVLAAMERNAEAAKAAQEAFATLAPALERYPEAHAGLARTIASDVVRYSAAAGVEPDGALLQRVVLALGDAAAPIGREAEPPAEAMLSDPAGLIPAPPRRGLSWGLKAALALILLAAVLAGVVLIGGLTELVRQLGAAAAR